SFTGFKEQVVNDVAVGAEEVQGVNVVIQPGVMKETVTVTAEAQPQLQTENANVTGNISNQEVHALPQTGRDPDELVRLAPGAHVAPPGMTNYASWHPVKPGATRPALVGV